MAMRQVSMRAQDKFIAKLMRRKQRSKTKRAKPKIKRTNYARGAEIERRIVNQARQGGKIAARTAGSHSAIDVFVIDEQDESIDLIQCKRSKDGTFPKIKSPFREGYYYVRFKQVNYQDRVGYVEELPMS